MFPCDGVFSWEVVFAPELLLLELGGVNGRNPSFDFAPEAELPPARFAGVDGPRASFGDIAGA